jgi:triphosphoribosyl-dephospho-CoA synthase
LLIAYPDSLIARKLGPEAARRVSDDARAVLDLGGVRTRAGREALAKFDSSVRDPGNARNPGATADLTAAAIFVMLLEHGVD